MFIGTKGGTKMHPHDPQPRPPHPSLGRVRWGGVLGGLLLLLLLRRVSAWAVTWRSLLDVLSYPTSHSCHPGIDTWEVGPATAIAPAGDPS